MKVLELFSGTGSVGKVCKNLGWDVVSLDLLLPADLQIDILDFDYKQYSKDEFDIVWGSPPCVAYSNLQNSWVGRMKKDGLYTKEKMEQDMKDADKLVLKTLETINYFKPKYWFIENPKTGRLKDREIMKNLNYYDVDYCKYCDWGYRKRTRIWTNRTDFEPKLCNKDCENMIDASKHKKDVSINVGGGGDTRKYVYKGNHRHKGQVVSSKRGTKGLNEKLDRYRIPEKLILDLFNI